MSAIFNKELSAEQLNELFQSDEKCFEFLADLKWSRGFECRKCGNTNFCQVKQHTPDDVQNVRQKSPLRLAPSFIIASFRSTRLFILLIMFAKGKMIFLPMSLHDGYLSGR